MAEEVVQETMVKIWRKADQYDPAGPCFDMDFHNRTKYAYRPHSKVNRPEPDMNDPAFVPDPEPLAVEMIASIQDAGRLHKAMANLSDEQRAVLKLAYFEDKAHPEIAEALDIPSVQ